MTSSGRYVLDASVAYKWLMPFPDLENDIDTANRVLEDYRRSRIDLIAPHLIVYELFSVCHKEREHYSLSLSQIKNIVNNFQRLHIPLLSANITLVRLAADIGACYGFRPKCQDTHYLALAQHKDLLWLTADTKASQKVGNLCKLLSDY